MAEQRSAAAEHLAGKRPPRLEHRPEECGEQEGPGEQGDRVAPARSSFGEEEVEREAQARDAGARDSQTVDLPAPELHDQHEAAEAEDERNPEPPADRFVEREARPQRDDERRDELDQ